jgi:hypothetical protein
VFAGYGDVSFGVRSMAFDLAGNLLVLGRVSSLSQCCRERSGAERRVAGVWCDLTMVCLLLLICGQDTRVFKYFPTGPCARRELGGSMRRLAECGRRMSIRSQLSLLLTAGHAPCQKRVSLGMAMGMARVNRPSSDHESRLPTRRYGRRPGWQRLPVSPGQCVKRLGRGCSAVQRRHLHAGSAVQCSAVQCSAVQDAHSRSACLCLRLRDAQIITKLTPSGPCSRACHCHRLRRRSSRR